MPSSAGIIFRAPIQPFHQRITSSNFNVAMPTCLIQQTDTWNELDSLCDLDVLYLSGGATYCCFTHRAYESGFLQSNKPGTILLPTSYFDTTTDLVQFLWITAKNPSVNCPSKLHSSQNFAYWQQIVSSILTLGKNLFWPFFRLLCQTQKLLHMNSSFPGSSPSFSVA